MACQACGSPKDESEEYEMPADTASAATVTDPSLLRLARAGANWRCRYCGSDQRTLAGTCAQCGSAQAEGRSTAGVAPVAPAVVRVARPPLGTLLFVAGVCALLLVVAGSLVFSSRGGTRVRSQLGRGAAALAPPFHFETATVVAVRWKQSVTVERWQVTGGEGFEEAKPAEAFEVRPAGSRFHHKERVVAGYDTQSYTETVPDGYRTETYSAQESCGQDCTPRPQSCSEKCTPNKNGFASCKTVCSGGGQDCRTKYCNVTKTRQVPQTKTVTKTRQVPRYADVERSATWYTWKVWAWKVARTLEKSGSGTKPEWPGDAEVKLGKGLGPGERERENRRGDYRVELTAGATPRVLALPGPEALGSFAPGSQRTLRVWNGGRVEAL